MVDATLIAAPSSTKNASGERDPEMHQSQKGNQWHFGMKAHIGVHAVAVVSPTPISCMSCCAAVQPRAMVRMWTSYCLIRLSRWATSLGRSPMTRLAKPSRSSRWSFALEWNDNYTFIGCFGNESACNLELDKSPKLKPDWVFGDGAAIFAIRRGMPLTEVEGLVLTGPSDEG